MQYAYSVQRLGPTGFGDKATYSLAGLSKEASLASTLGQIRPGGGDDHIPSPHQLHRSRDARTTHFRALLRERRFRQAFDDCGEEHPPHRVF